jgi:hypothetical protein
VSLVEYSADCRWREIERQSPQVYVRPAAKYREMRPGKREELGETKESKEGMTNKGINRSEDTKSTRKSAVVGLISVAQRLPVVYRGVCFNTR